MTQLKITDTTLRDAHQSLAATRMRTEDMLSLAAEMEKRAADPAEQTVFISHGDCLEDAQLLEKILQEKYGVKSAFIYYVGAVIGSHSGPGTLALFFMGSKR
jgi:fatty acid-binding protein DegV